MAFVRKIKAALVRMDSSLYVGEGSYLFYDIETACIRITDGTPGGRAACIEGSSGDDPTYVTPSVPPAGTDIIVTFDSTVNIAIKYLVVIENLITSDSQSIEVHAFGGLGKNTFNVHSKLGDRVKYTLDLVVNGVTRELYITNREPDNIKIRVTQLGVVKL